MIQNIISNPTLYNLTQSTATQVTIETTLKAIGRPGFILVDNQIDKKTKKFAAMKEFLYQMTCLGIYLAMIPWFKKGAYSLAKKVCKNEAVFKAFPKAEDLAKFHKMNEQQKVAKLAELNSKITTGDKFVRENINEDFAKGVIEGGSIFGSIAGLAILAPIVSHPLIHPVLNALGFSEHNEKK